MKIQIECGHEVEVDPENEWVPTRCWDCDLDFEEQQNEMSGEFTPEFQEVACIRCGYATHKCKCRSLGYDTAWCLVCNTDTGFCDQSNHPERDDD